MEDKTKISVGDVIRAFNPENNEVTYYMLGYSIRDKSTCWVDLSGIIVDNAEGDKGFVKYHLDNMLDKGYDIELIKGSDFIEESERLYGDVEE